MNKVRGIAMLCLLMVVAPVMAQDKKAESKGPSEADMAAMMAAAQPGENHKHLSQMAGDWEVITKAWMAPGQPPMESTGTMHAEMMMGGRYVQHHWKGSFGNMPFEGQGTEAYDNMTKKFVSSWIDNMGTGIMMSTGTCDEAGKVCTQVGDTMDPMSGQSMTMKSVITWADNNHFKNEMFVKDAAGNEMKMMEITASRKK
jgi:hypothetical protein